MGNLGQSREVTSDVPVQPHLASYHQVRSWHILSRKDMPALASGMRKYENVDGAKTLSLSYSAKIQTCLCEQTIDILFEFLHQLEFFWAKYLPFFRFKADVWGKDVKLGKIQKAQINEIISEKTQQMSHLSPTPCQAILEVPGKIKVIVCRVYTADYSPSVPEIIPKDDNCRMIYKNTKYFCKRCDIYICNGCFSSDCMNHDVQWIGNATFVCESIYHKPVAC